MKNFIILCISIVFVVFPFKEESKSTELHIGFSEDAITLDPANHRRRETETIIRNIYDGLLTRTPRMLVIPQLAESWKQLDPVTYEFTIHRDVQFHNGDILTVDDIKFTFERLTKKKAMEGKTSPRKNLLPDIKTIEIVDSRTIRFVLRTAWPQLPSMLPLQEIVSRSFIEANRSSDLNKMANGTGPFKLVEWRKGQFITMQRFDEYYGGSTSLPPVSRACVERIKFHIMPDNAVRVAALLEGEVHIINKLPADSIEKVIQSNKAIVMKTPGTRTYFVALNVAKPPFNDIKVRKALNHALNRKKLIQKHYQGGANPVNGVLSPFAFGHNKDLPAYDYDPSRSRDLLATSSFDFKRTLILETVESVRGLAEDIANMLNKIGVKTSVKLIMPEEIKRNWVGNNSNRGDMLLSSWGNSSLDPIGIFTPTLRSGGRGNSSGYSNAEVDALLDAAAEEIEQPRRARLYMQAEALINRDTPWIFLWVPEDLYGVSKRVTRWQPSPDGRINLHDVCINQP